IAGAGARRAAHLSDAAGLLQRIADNISGAVFEPKNALAQARGRHKPGYEPCLRPAASLVMRVKVALPVAGQDMSAQAAAEAVIHDIWPWPANTVCVPLIGVQC